MDYKETLQYLFSQLPMYQRQGKAAYKANLDNTWALMDILDHPYRDFKSIHIGGTNGKGSTSHMMASVLQEAGYKVGLYTSPHLKDFRERVRINGEMIPEAAVTEFVDQYQTEFESIGLSFFEWTVGLAFKYFADQAVDIAVIEVGMGGRLDSTNVVDPLISIITNIGLDHTQFLGETKNLIAGEKAGIIKSNRPVIIGETHPETQQVFKAKAHDLNAPITFADQIANSKIYETDLLGSYQTKNQKTLLASLPYLKNAGLEITEKAIENGLKNVVSNTTFLGRWQVISKQPLTICDTGHNEDGLISILKQIKTLEVEHVHFVLGMVNDKEVGKLLKLFPQAASYYFCKAAIPRSLDGEALMQKAAHAGLSGRFYGSVKNAYHKAKNHALADDLIFIGGSTFVVADFLENME